MRSRWGESAFRPDPSANADRQPLRVQSLALLAVLVLLTGAITAAAYLVRPDHARSFQLLHGSLFLADQVAPVGIDLASGKPTLRLVGAEKQVGARSPNELAVVPVEDGTLLLDRATGQFNMVDNTGFVIKHDNGGVPLPARADPTASTGVGAGAGAYVERTGPAGTDVYLVDQLTVQAATNLQRRVAPRASTRVAAPGSTAPGASAASDGTFWALLGSGAHRTVHEFDVAADAPRGARLSDARRAAVTGAAAIGTAGDSGAAPASTAVTTSTADDAPADPSAITGDAAVGVASADGIRYFGASAPRTGQEVRYPGEDSVTGLDTVLAVTSSSSRLAYLLHGSAGWSVVSLARDGTGLRGPTALRGVPAGAQLATPAMSEGSAYTVDRATGMLYRIDLSGTASAVTGARHYPLAERDGHVAESSDLGDAYITARGPRVFIDSPSHVDAVALFTDGSRGPLVVRKSAAVDVSAAGGAQALTQGDTGNQRGHGKSTQSRHKNVGQAINNRVDCHTVSQQPHIPVITQATPGSRTVALAWTYPLLDSQDCAPSTYVVSVALESGDAPTPDGSATVQGQQSTILTGLYPQSRYKITVTAYLQGQGTPSAPIQVITGKQGPAAPTGIAVTADSTGNWHVAFNSCGTVANGCVPAASWRVTASFCDGRGLSAPPATIVSPADPSSVAQPAVTVPGNDDLLGRGLRFQIEGDGAQGELGTPSAPSGCVYSWTPPVATDISLSASTPPRTDSNGTTSTTATVRFARGQTHDLGGVGGTVTYQLLTQGRIVTTAGPTTSPSVVLDGVRAGQGYTVRVLATAPRHPSATATIGPEAVSAAIADWPTPSVSAAFRTTSATEGTLDVTVAFPTGTDTRGETFDLVGATSSLDCDSAGYPLQRNDFSPGNTLSFPGISRLDFASNDCTVTVQLAQDPRTETTPALYGAANSAQVRSAAFAVPDPDSTTTDADFSAVWSGDQTHPRVTLSYDGSGDPAAHIASWRSTVTNGTTDDCGTSHVTPTVTIDVSPSCITEGGTFTVQVSYDFFGTARNFTVGVSGTAPQPVNPDDVSFTAAWETSTPTVDVTYTGSQPRGDLAPLSFTETITSTSQVDPDVDCADATVNPADADGDPMQIPVDLGACPATDSTGAAAQYTVTVQYVDTTYNQAFNQAYLVGGLPPS